MEIIFAEILKKTEYGTESRVYRWGLHEWRALLACISESCYGGCPHTDANVPYVPIPSSISSYGPAGPLLLCPDICWPNSCCSCSSLQAHTNNSYCSCRYIYLIIFQFPHIIVFPFLCFLETFFNIILNSKSVRLNYTNLKLN